MRILGHVHTYEESEEVIARVLRAMQTQTYPLSEILLVDNGPHGRFRQELLEGISYINSGVNLGVSGAVTIGLRYAIEKQFDWVWILDGDSVPNSDALEMLVYLYTSLPGDLLGQIGALHCAVMLDSGKAFLGRHLTPGGARPTKIKLHEPYCECDASFWSGSLVSVSAACVVGFPRCGQLGYWDDMSQEYSDMEYDFRLRQAGYKILVHRFSQVQHGLGNPMKLRLLGFTFVSTNHPASRRYLFFRNLVYFWLYLYPRRDWIVFSLWFLYRFAATVSGIVFIETDRSSKIWACIRGVWDGFRRNLRRPYGGMHPSMSR